MKGGLGMKKIVSTTAMVFLIGAVLFGCQAHRPGLIDPSFQAMDLNSKLQAGEYEQKIDNFYVVLDRSGSKEETYRGHTNFAIANDFLTRMNSSIPDMDLKSGLRTFGATYNPFAKETDLIYGITDYSRQGFQEALESVGWGGGLSPVDEAFNAASSDMSILQGKAALIFVGDGQYKGYDPAAAIKQMKESYGENLCVYPVLVGSEEPASVATMQDIAAAGECGYYQSVKYLDTPQNLADWVAAVFLSEVEKKAAVAAPPPQPGDGDGDGVTDDIDQCPDTPVGASVNERGCWLIDDVYFDFDKSNIKSEFIPVLVEVADVMKQNPGLTVRVEGHTDNLGTVEYNQKLSEKRAMAAKQYLLDQGISEDRISTASFGYSMPAATNETEWGRAENRRVEFKWSL
jgi:OOP family OmpA-OmpF porin